MDLYVYQAPSGLIADFRPYLDGKDHSFDDHRNLPPADARWEKIRNLRDPETGDLIAGQIQLVGKANTRWFELMCFPVRWTAAYESVEAGH